MGKRGGWSRERFFIICLAAATTYCKLWPSDRYVFLDTDYRLLLTYLSADFLPGYLFTALSMFSWVCWIVPNNCETPYLCLWAG